MSCFVLNQSEGRVSNVDVANQLFHNENTTNSGDTGVQRNCKDENVLEIDITRLTWHIKNKYYKADVNVYVSNYTIPEKFRVPPIGAIVYYTDRIEVPTCESEKGHFIKKLDDWLSSHQKQKAKKDTDDEQNDTNACTDVLDSDEVRLVVVESFSSNDTKSATLNWAVNKGVEIIDLNDEEEDDEICTSLNSNESSEPNENKPLLNARVIEALQTVPWTTFDRSVEEKSEQDEKVEPQVDKSLAEGDFEDLMSKLSTFKQKSDELPREERYAFAEKIALSFFSAMGGEDESDSAE